MSDPKFGDLNQLIAACRLHGVSFNLSFEEGPDEIGVEIVSPDPTEAFFQKRIISISRFLEQWQERLTQEKAKR